MERALIVCDAPKGTAFFRDYLIQNGCDEVTTVDNGAEAKRRMVEGEYDICIINAPLRTETGERLSIELAEKNICQVLLFVKADRMEELTEKVEDYGVITVAKPISRQMFWSALKLARVTQRRLTMARRENAKLQKKIEDLKLVSRAKLVLISYAGMSEEEAHKYLERQAMDRRMPRADVAREVLDQYEQ